MATNFPTSVDNFTNPTANDSLNLPSHSTQHANANDAIEAIEGYLLTAPMGSRLVKSQAVGTTVSSVTVTSCFNSSYENYKIIYSGGVGSLAQAELYFQLTGITSGVYNSQLTYGTFGSNAAPATVNATTDTKLSWCGTCTNNANQFDLEIQSPFASKKKIGTGFFIEARSAGNNGVSRHWIDSTASATGFTITTSTGTITGGTIYVYGYTTG